MMLNGAIGRLTVAAAGLGAAQAILQVPNNNSASVAMLGFPNDLVLIQVLPLPAQLRSQFRLPS